VLKIQAPPLSKPTTKSLRARQARVNQAGTYATQVTEAKRLFAQYNKRGDAAFDEVKLALDRICPGVRRCHYCQDSCADEVEHIRPKDLYPREVFAWGNYLYACGPCNGPKNNRYAVIVNQQLVDVTRRRGARVTRPRTGIHAILDLRVDDPVRFLRLDLSGTFRFEVIPKRGSIDHLRATYTLDVLALNTRETLRRQRKNAYVGYLARLELYVKTRNQGPRARPRLAELADSLKSVDHPTVWSEMKRQRASYRELKALFAAAPEALTW
jgi:uncharacterized protein (TIGR02646 family)